MALGKFKQALRDFEAVCIGLMEDKFYYYIYFMADTLLNGLTNIYKDLHMIVRS